MLPEKIGRYEVKGELGQGGMATVYRAYDARVKREVAVKLLPRELTRDMLYSTRFQREAETIAALEHAAIVPVYDFGEENGQPYLVMRLMQAGSLADRLKQGALPLTEMVRICSRLAPALDYAHRKGIIHRDVKPDNILFDTDGDAYLADFGISKILQGQEGLVTATGIITGTPAYLSPEQARGDKNLDGRSDIYSLGATIFHALSGRLPYEADSPVNMILKHISAPLPPLLAFAPNLPPAVEGVVHKAMAKDPGDRFATAGEMAVRLVETLEGGTAVQPLVRRLDLQHKPASPRENMLHLVWNTWIEGLLGKSLYNEVLVEVGLQQRPGAVEHPWDMVLQMPEQADRFLPRGTEMQAVFAHAGGRLVVLGEPGTGKTTLLLTMARQAILAAQEDASRPIPVVFNLSSWGDRSQTIADWLLGEFEHKYYVNKKTALPWIQNGQLLLLLDGLDEVRPALQEACAQAINAFLIEYGMPVVVCGRTAEYERLEIRLKMGAAVCLQPLSPAQVDEFFQRTGLGKDATRQVLQRYEEIQGFVETPLMLSIITLAYQQASAQETHAAVSQQHLFDVYIQAMFARIARAKKERFSKDQLTGWLTWLASTMRKKDQSTFNMEDIRPEWLTRRIYRFLYLLMVFGLAAGGAAILLKAIGEISYWSMNSISQGRLIQEIFDLDRIMNHTLENYQSAWKMILLIMGVVSGLFSIKPGRFPVPTETWKWSWKKALGGSVIGTSFGFATIVYLFYYYYLISLGTTYLQFTLIGGLGGFLIGSLFSSVGYLAWMLFQKTRGKENNPRKWSWGIVLLGGWGGLVLGIVLAVILSIGEMVMMLGPNIAITCFGLILGFLLGGLVRGLSGEEVLTRSVVGQGVKSSLVNALMFGCSTWIISSAITFIALYFLIVRTTIFRSLGTLMMIDGGLTVGSFVGLIIGLIYGGNFVLRHVVLRGCLYLEQGIPWNLAAVLDDAVEKLFLRRIGGGYVFVHRLLLEHFAALKKDA